MLLSPAEKSYLFESLKSDPIIRPDSRSDHQYRPLEAKTSFLPASNGSSRIRLSDGSECIVSVKAKVVKISEDPNLIDLDIDIIGHRDDSNYISTLKFQLLNLLQQNFDFDILKLTNTYSFKLCIDCIIVNNLSYPLSLLSLCIYLALKTTRLPLLISDSNDEEVAELPTFSDDWNDSKYLHELSKDGFQPPIFITVGVVGSNLLIDPSKEEESVLENGLVFSFYNNQIITPIMNTNFALNTNNSNFKGLDKKILIKALIMGQKYCPTVLKALDGLIEEDLNDNDGNIF